MCPKKIVSKNILVQKNSGPNKFGPKKFKYKKKVGLKKNLVKKKLPQRYFCLKKMAQNICDPKTFWLKKGLCCKKRIVFKKSKKILVGGGGLAGWLAG